MDLCLQLHTFKKGDLTIDEYILRIKMIFDYLVAIGQPVPDHDLFFYAYDV